MSARAWMYRSALALALWPVVALAGDGVIEINQACVSAGCFPADAPGFPVTITESGSYRLTSNLVVPDENTTAIELGADADRSSIDLNGFAILGPTSCSGIGFFCIPVGTGHGIAANITTTDVTVRNGRVIGMGDHGIFLQNFDYVEGVVARSNGGIGIEVGPFSSVINCQAVLNGGSGIRVDENISTGQFGNAGETVLHGNLAVRNGRVPSANGLDMEGGGRTGGNRCSDRSCSTRGLRRYFLTEGDPVDGGNAAAECPAGFHVASVWELINPSSLHYDSIRGYRVSPNIGSGPQTLLEGWAFVGDGATCLGYDDPGVGAAGSIIVLSDDHASQDLGPWDVSTAACDSTFARVWCIED